ncbi:glycosyltransferase 87 family protein [Nocardioides pacificus]
MIVNEGRVHRFHGGHAIGSGELMSEDTTYDVRRAPSRPVAAGLVAVLASPRVAGVVLLCSLIAQVVWVTLVDRPAFVDLHVYLAEGQAVRDGIDLYGPLPGVHGLATYPPFAAILFVPGTYPPVALVESASVVLNAALVVLAAWLSVRLVTGGPARAFAGPVALLAAAALWAEPVLQTSTFGQVNLLLLCLVLADLCLPAGSRLQGVGIGLATAIKVTPAIFVLHLLLIGRIRAAVTACATGAATVLVSLAVARQATWDYWTAHVFDAGRVGRPENSVNQTLRGWLVRATHTRDTGVVELLVIALVLVAGLAVAALAHRELGTAWGLLAAALTGLVVSPISWSHHWVWCIPALALCWRECRWLAVLGVAVFWSFTVWWVPHGDMVELDLSPWEIAMSGWYVVFALAFLTVAAARVRRTRAAGQRAGSTVPRTSPNAIRPPEAPGAV